jgi:hypothetical protein
MFAAGGSTGGVSGRIPKGELYGGIDEGGIGDSELLIPPNGFSELMNAITGLICTSSAKIIKTANQTIFFIRIFPNFIL